MWCQRGHSWERDKLLLSAKVMRLTYTRYGNVVNERVVAGGKCGLWTGGGGGEAAGTSRHIVVAEVGLISGGIRVETPWRVNKASACGTFGRRTCSQSFAVSAFSDFKKLRRIAATYTTQWPVVLASALNIHPPFLPAFVVDAK